MKQKKSSKKYNSIEKALEILLEFNQEKYQWGVRELSQHLGFSPATVQRILQTLKAYNFVDQNPESRQYILGSAFFNFLTTLHNSNRVPRTARRFMEIVAAETKETVHLNIIEGKNRICIDTLESPRNLRAGMPIGDTSPLYAGASARCLLAFSPPIVIKTYIDTTPLVPITDHTIIDMKLLKKELKKINIKGYAQSLGERTSGIGAVSAPVLDHNGSVLASLSLAIPEIRYYQKDHLDKCIRVLIKASESFSRSMGFNP